MNEMVTAGPLLPLVAVALPVATGLVAMVLGGRRRRTAMVLVAAAGPALTLVLLAIHLQRHGVADAGAATTALPWVPSLHLDISFLVDGLATFFALLVAGVGVAVVLYSRAYFGPDDAALARFLPSLGFFTTAMLGVVLADHLLLTVLFWEITSISSFLLIGWERDDPEAGRRAMQAFATTGLGGLALLGGVLLFGGATDVWQWSQLADGSTTVNPDGAVVAAFVLMFVGAAAKSAQWPLHDWLPGAMRAPTPISAYLHSATMVKAGVFLVARMLPVFGGLAIWVPLVSAVGATTMLLGAVLALRQHDLKRIFAYTTVSHLGLLMAVYGLGGTTDGHGDPAIGWDLTQVASHALYKAPLFLAAGALGVLVGAKRLPDLFGLWSRSRGGTRASLLVLLVAGYALAGGPGTLAFTAKELFLEAVDQAAAGRPAVLLIGLAGVAAATCNVAIFVRLTTTVLGLRNGIAPDATVPSPAAAPRTADRWSVLLWAPAGAMVGLQVLGGLVPMVWSAVFRPLEAYRHADGLPAPLAPFLHPGLPLFLSLTALAAGTALGLSSWARSEVTDPHSRLWPAIYRGILRGGHRAFHTVQTGHVRLYLTVVFGALLVGIGWATWADPDMIRLPKGISPLESTTGLLLGAVVCATAIALPLVVERVVRVLVLGASGFAVVGLYLLYQAPDLALTQLMFEIISVILFLLVLRLLPRPDKRPRIRVLPRLALASVVGLTIGWMTLLAGHAAEQRVDEPTLGTFFEAHSLGGSQITDGRGGEGRNIVNVILVDFRGFDTLGEITVLATAALGVWSMLPGRRRHHDRLTVDPDTSAASGPETISEAGS